MNGLLETWDRRYDAHIAVGIPYSQCFVTSIEALREFMCVISLHITKSIAVSNDLRCGAHLT
jgi:hypothetical protein